MPVFLRQSTAVDLAIGPFLDATDGVTAETALTISQADVRLKKNNAAWAQINDNTSATHEENGWYEKEFDATDTNTVGRLVVAIHESGALPVWHEFWVLEEAIYDALFAASATGALPVSSGGIASTAFAAGAIDAAAIATDAIGAAELADGAITAATFAAGAITATVIATDAIDADAIAADAIGASELAAGAVTEIQSGLATAAALDTVDNLIDTEVGAIKTVVDAIQAKTDNLPSDPADASAIAASFVTTDGLITTVDTVVDAVKAKTDNLPASPAAVGSAMTLDLTQALDLTPTTDTVGDALVAAVAQGFGKWTLSGTTLTLYAHDGTTVVRTFTLDDSSDPTSRT